MWNFQDTFETRKQSFISAFSICMTVLLTQEWTQLGRAFFSSIGALFRFSKKGMGGFSPSPLVVRLIEILNLSFT